MELDEFLSTTEKGSRFLFDILCAALKRIGRLDGIIHGQPNRTLSPITAHFNIHARHSLEKQSVCCSRGNLLQPSEDLRALDFFESVNYEDSATLQGQVLAHCIGRTLLEEPLCISVTASSLCQTMRQSRVLNQTKLTPDEKKSIRNILFIEHNESSPNSEGVAVVPQMDSILCCPLSELRTKIVTAFVCLVNKSHSQSFTTDDEQIALNVLRFTVPLLQCSAAYHNEKILKNWSEQMLSVAANIFSNMMDLTSLLLRIMQEARGLTKAERCSVFLLETETNELVARVLDGLPTAPTRDLPQQIRIPLDQGIAGYVAKTGEILNIKDAYKHPLFYRGVDEQTGFRTRNILCFPIKNEKNGIVGVAQLCNKIGRPYFTSADENIAQTFSVYCCISIVHSLMYQQVEDAQYRTRLANEVMMYHMSIPQVQLDWLLTSEIPSLESMLKDAYSFTSVPRDIQLEQDSVLAVMAMFDELGLTKLWRIPKVTLSYFVLLVQRGYRNPAYHNWRHAYSVCHFAGVCEKNLNLVGRMLSDIEFFGLFVSTLCHDIDHRGTSNSFQLQSQSLLATLYSSQGSVLEQHHFSQTICILNTAGCNIFQNLRKEEYSKMLDMIRCNILATDLANHLALLPNIRKMIGRGFDKTNDADRRTFMDFIMTVSDLSDQTKCWRNTLHVAKLIYDEFFNQGDLELRLGNRPAEDMDRERACVPRLQISFLDYVVLPTYQPFVSLFPEASILVKNIESNKMRWTSILNRVQSGQLNGNGFAIFEQNLLEENTDDQ